MSPSDLDISGLFSKGQCYPGPQQTLAVRPLVILWSIRLAFLFLDLCLSLCSYFDRWLGSCCRNDQDRIGDWDCSAATHNFKEGWGWINHVYRMEFLQKCKRTGFRELPESWTHGEAGRVHLYGLEALHLICHFVFNLCPSLYNKLASAHVSLSSVKKISKLINHMEGLIGIPSSKRID